MLKDKIAGRKAGILTYGMTPPKLSNPPDRIAEISRKQMERLQGLELDALILYDVQEEAGRMGQDRPFPYLQTIDPAVYGREYLGEWKVPQVIYRCVGNDSEKELAQWVQADAGQDRYSVFVGASSSKQEVKLELTEAYSVLRRLDHRLTLGGVIIPERHMVKQDEHLRVLQKTKAGCQFFITQATYNVEATKNFLSDYYGYCMNHGLERETVPILINLAPCGSPRTLDFMKWLGISIPRWLENELKYANDVLDKSIRLSRAIFEEILDFGLEKGIPIGCSIESVSTRKVEIEASIQMLKDVKAVLTSRGL